MLGNYLINPVLLSKDLSQARHFYGDLLGLEIVNESDKGIWFRSSEGTLSVTKSTVGTKDEQTQASWRVDDVRAEVKALRERGVKIEQYDSPGFKTDEDGIVDIGFALTAYIIDPDKNALSILQLTDLDTVP
jgi:catechol 2,3-dioxygenase-like lactoylglutathione lyase family enzyme